MALRLPIALTLLTVMLLLAAAASACGEGSAESTEARVTIEPIASSTPRPLATPTAPAEPAATPEPEIENPAEAEPAGEAPPPPAPTTTTAPAVGPPAEGRWIDVDVTTFMVRLMDGQTVVQEIGPVAVGAQIDTGEYLSTQTGLFRVYSMIEPLSYDAPFDTYISHWVGFDPAKDNGFHSFLKDANGNVVDASTGRVSNGCIRTGGAEAIYAFAEIGMPVYVHH